MTKKSDSKIVEAVGSAGNDSADLLNPSAIQEAMAQAAADAQADGITDPDEIRDRVLAAREQVKKAKV
jgi:formaldehyde-activating enzyme involved in methanogenesis